LLFGQVIHPFDAQADGELSLAVGEYVVVRQVHGLLYLLTIKFYRGCGIPHGQVGTINNTNS